MKWFKNNSYQNWEETRKIGRTKFALTHGISFAIIVFITNTFVFWITESKNLLGFTNLLIFFMICIILGIFGYYTFMWWIQETIYHRKSKN
jgi:amino acid permease